MLFSRLVIEYGTNPLRMLRSSCFLSFTGLCWFEYILLEYYLRLGTRMLWVKEEVWLWAAKQGDLSQAQCFFAEGAGEIGVVE